MTDPLRVVYDCNIFLQALAKPTGPSGACVALALEGKVALFVSEIVLEEIRDVTARQELIRRFKLRPDRVQVLLDNLSTAAVLLTEVPEVWTYDRDPDDAHYVNLAVAAGAKLIVSRDRDLLDLSDTGRADPREFRSRFPDLKVVDPISFLREMKSDGLLPR